METKTKPWRNLPSWMRGRLSDPHRFLVLCICAGVVCGLVGVSFYVAIHRTFEFLFGFYETLGAWAWPAMVLSPALAGLLVGVMVNRFSPSATGSGIPQTKAAYYHKFGVIPIREALWRFAIGVISIGAGNSLGREGPTIHICSAFASKIGRFFGLGKLRVQAMVPVGMGAGISAAFNAPISAITFVFEELLDDFSSKALGGILIAAVVAAAIERLILGDRGSLQGETMAFQTSWWMLMCLGLGPTAALFGQLFTSFILTLRGRFQQWRRFPAWAKPAIGGLGVGLIGVTVLQLSPGHTGIFGIGYADLNAALAGNLAWKTLLLLFIGKMLATGFCYASGASGGIFAPVLFIGAMLGGLFGTAYVHFFQADPSIIAGAALLGTGAFFAAVIRCPITSILIIFEMTRNYSLILPLMVGNLIAYALSVKMRSVPIYDALLLQDGISLKKLPAYRGERDWRNLPVSTLMTHDCRTVLGNQTAAENLKTIEASGHKHHGYPVVAEEPAGQLLGVITHNELAELAKFEESRPVHNWIRNQKIVHLFPDTSIRDAANTLVLKDVLQAPVVSRKDPQKLLGIVTLHDIARQQNAIEESFAR